MLLQRHVRTAIDAAEESFLRCLETLCKMKAREVDLRDLLEFQPLLASSLFDLDSMYAEACKEKRGLIARKASIPPHRYKQRLSLLERYRQVLKASAERGRILGDNFAWLFYCREELCIHEHLEHEPVPHIPSGFGGFAEVSFVKQFPLLDGRFLVLYHGTTNFLRIGDVSLIDTRNFRLAGLGELKAGPVENGQGRVTLVVVSGKHVFKGVSAAPCLDNKHPVQVRSPERFDRQLERMSGAVAASMPTETQYIRLSIDYSGLKGALEEALSIGSSFRNLSASLAVVVTALPRDPSLYSRITSAPPESVLDTISAVPGQLVQLVVDDSKDNDFWPSRLPLSYITGVTPNFWTRMPKELVKALFQQRIDVTTVYNPARFIQRLRTFGFRVEFVPGEDRLSVVRTIRGAEIKIEKVRHFIDLIQCYLVDEIAVANYINDLVQNSSQSAQGAVIHCLPMQKHPGIEDLDQ